MSVKFKSKYTAAQIEAILDKAHRDDNVDQTARDAAAANALQIQKLDSTKVDKILGKQLSTNDFTNEYKEKLDLIEDKAQVNLIELIKIDKTALDIKDKVVTIPPATNISLGVVQGSTNENGITIDENNNNLSVYSLNVNKLVQSEDQDLILDCGQAEKKKSQK